MTTTYVTSAGWNEVTEHGNSLIVFKLLLENVFRYKHHIIVEWPFSKLRYIETSTMGEEHLTGFIHTHRKKEKHSRFLP